MAIGVSPFRHIRGGIMLTLIAMGLGGCFTIVDEYPAVLLPDTQVPLQDTATETATTSDPTIVPTSSLSPTETPAPTATDTPTATPSPIPEEGEPFVVGYSVAGRPIHAVRFGSGPTERMIMAGIHGGYEWNTVELANALIEYIKDNPAVVPPDKTVYVLPLINPDGYARGFDHAGRLNENGVDINRNFDAHWSSTWVDTVCWKMLPVSAGEHPASEPETQTLIQFVEAHPAIDALISYHSAGRVIFPGGQPVDPASARLASALAQVSFYAYPPNEVECQFTGQLTDWAVGKGIPAVDVELSSHGEIDFRENVRVLLTFLIWNP